MLSNTRNLDHIVLLCEDLSHMRTLLSKPRASRAMANGLCSSGILCEISPRSMRTFSGLPVTPLICHPL